MEYPEWLQGIVADAVEPMAPPGPPGIQQMWAYGVADRVLDALGFHPDLREFIRKGRVHENVDVWEGSAMNPVEKERRRKALDEIARLGEEIENGDAT